jgi:ribosomal protein L34E
MPEEILTIITEYKCPKQECQLHDGGARLVRATHQSNEEPKIPNCTQCGDPMQAMRCWANSFQREF